MTEIKRLEPKVLPGGALDAERPVMVLSVTHAEKMSASVLTRFGASLMQAMGGRFGGGQLPEKLRNAIEAYAHAVGTCALAREDDGHEDTDPSEGAADATREALETEIWSAFAPVQAGEIAARALATVIQIEPEQFLRETADVKIEQNLLPDGTNIRPEQRLVPKGREITGRLVLVDASGRPKAQA